MSNQVTKKDLIEEVSELKKQLFEKTEKADLYDDLKLKYDILKTARKEDKDAVENANKVVAEFRNRETEIVNHFKAKFGQMETNLQEQNKTILTLFEMMDNSINQQIFYYNKFKSIFVDMNVTKEE